MYVSRLTRMTGGQVRWCGTRLTTHRTEMKKKHHLEDERPVQECGSDEGQRPFYREPEDRRDLRQRRDGRMCKRGRVHNEKNGQLLEGDVG